MGEKWKYPAAFVFLALVFLGKIAHGAAAPDLAGGTADPDLWIYLSFGRCFWQDGMFPFRDVFSYLPVKETWIFHEWLSALIFYPVFKALGPAGLQAIRYGVSLGLIWIILRAAKRQGATAFGAAAAQAAAMPLFIFGFSPVRAHIFTFLLLALSLFILEGARKNEKFSRLWLFGPIGLLWADLHGGFPAGLGVILLYALGQAVSRRTWKPYLGAGVLFFCATLINPYFFSLWTFVLKASSGPWPEIVEWASVFKGASAPAFSGLFGLTALLAASAIVLVSRYGAGTAPVLILAACAYMAFAHIRHIVLFAIAFGVYAPPLISRVENGLLSTLRRRFGARMLEMASACGIILCMAGASIYFISNFSASSFIELQTPPASEAGPDDRGFYYPVGAVDYISRNKITGRILTDFAWGSYVTWRLYPDCLAAVDGRTDAVFPDVIHEEYFAFRNAEKGWRDFVNKHPHDMILFSTYTRVSRLLSESPEWKVLYRDSGSVLFLRDSSGHGKDFAS